MASRRDRSLQVVRGLIASLVMDHPVYTAFMPKQTAHVRPVSQPGKTATILMSSSKNYFLHDSPSRLSAFGHPLLSCLTAPCRPSPLFLNSCSTDIVFVTLLCSAVETAISKVHKPLGTGGVPTSLTLLFWRWLTVSSVFAGWSVGMSY